MLAQRSLPATDAAMSARWLLADAAARRVYAVGADGAATFSLDDATELAHWPLPATSTETVIGATLDASGRLDLASAQTLLTLDPISGAELSRQPLPSGSDITLSGPVYDAHTATLALVVSRAGSPPMLLRFRAPSLQPLGLMTLPAGMALGPAEPQGGLLLFDARERTWRLNPLSDGTPGAQPRLAEQPALRGARALGWNASNGRIVAALPGTLLVLSSAEATPLAELPLMVAWEADQPLPVDDRHGLVSLPAGADGVLILRETPAPSHAPLDTTTAALLARAALAHLLPLPSQQPPFMRASDLPITPGTRSWSFWTHSDDLGWLGPFAGTLSTSITPVSGHPGAYAVTYMIAWEQLFRRTHTWSLSVAPDGAVWLTAERGDALP
jgi:hypothetical protein